ncbi:hypothetical protein QJS66_11570 [Kocuria rhizophila]|nr:hypothetical protein QJS66_11570 [Kocuria rhizophila]
MSHPAVPGAHLKPRPDPHRGEEVKQSRVSGLRAEAARPRRCAAVGLLAGLTLAAAV